MHWKKVPVAAAEIDVHPKTLYAAIRSVVITRAAGER
jgi:hypothetical protein